MFRLVLGCFCFMAVHGSLLCNWPECYPASDSSSVCRPNCYHELCDFMRGVDGFDPCQSICGEGMCDLRKLGNSMCDTECSGPECAYDYGDCNFCAVGCQADMLGNGVCDPACNVVACSFDAQDCQLCSSDCPLSQLGNGVCDAPCNNVNCNFDSGDCPVMIECLPSMLGNGVCNQECFSAENNWDSGDCDCAPNCSLMMRMDNKCDQECNNPECNFDERRCVNDIQVECAPGCFFKFEKDGVCRPECNIPECNYDFDCFCSPSCLPSLEITDSCLNQCMTLNCDFNNYGQPGGCNDEVMFKISSYYQSVAKDADSLFDVSACEKSGCDFASYQAALRSNQCVLSCNTPECAYSLGLCIQQLDWRCEIGYGIANGECFKCKDPYFQYFGYCIEACPRGYAPRPLQAKICIQSYSEDSSSDAAPDQIYTHYDLTQPVVSQGNVYRTLNDAMAAAWMKYSEILLLGETMIFNPYYVFSVDNQDYLPRPQLPDLVLGARWRQLTIRSVLCAEKQMENCADIPTTIYLERLYTITLNSRNLTLDNVIITTSRYFMYQDVKYCPYFQTVGAYYVSDRGRFVYGVQWTNLQCKNFTDVSMFVVKTDSTLELRNVKFEDVTLQLKAIIELEGGHALLTNVDFTNVQPSMGVGAVIFQSISCDSIEYCSRVLYRGGVISYMNNGYEFRRDMKLNPFISAQVLTIFEMTGVIVTFSAVSDVVSTHGFIMLNNFLSVTISDCEFSNNFFVGSLLSISSTVILPTTQQDSQSRLIYFLTSHISIKSSVFRQNYSRRSLIKITVSRDLLNIAIADCKFEQNALAEGSFAEVIYEGVVGEKEITGMNVLGLWASPRWLNATGITFNEVSSFDTLLSITNYANVLISGLNLTRNGELDELASADAMRFYISTPIIYASVLPSFGSDLACSSLITLTKVINIDVSNTTITDNKCSEGGTGVVFSTATGTNTVKNVFASGNAAAKASGVVLSVYENVLMDVWNLTAIQNTHSDRGVVYMTSGTQFHINSSRFEGNIGYSGGCINSEGSTVLFIFDSVFIENKVALGSGGAIYFISNATSAPEFLILRCEFTGNRATFGGAIFLSFPLYGDPLAFHIVSTRFRANFADVSGSSLHTTALLQLMPDSSIFNCSFESEVSTGGVICLQHIAGTLTISDAKFENNEGSLSAGINIQTSAMGRTVLDTAEFRGCRLGPAIAKPNSRIYSEVQTSECSFEGGKWPQFALENGYWEDFGSNITSSQVTAIEATLNSRCVLSATHFSANSSPKSGGAIHLSGQSILHCEDCHFSNNSATINGGAIFAEQNSAISIEKSYFEGNYAGQSGAGIYLLSTSRNNSVISECEFTENTGGDSSAISCFSSTFQLLSSLVRNVVSDINAGISIRLSTVTVFNSSFIARKKSSGPFLSVLTTSSVVVSNSSFVGGQSSIIGAVSLISSNLTVFASVLSNIGGRVFSVSSLSFLSLQIVTVRDLTTSEAGNVVYISESSLDISNSFIMRYELGAIYGSGVSSMTISNTIISDGSGLHGSAVSCYKCRYVAIVACQVVSQAAVQGALFFDSDTVAGTVVLTDTQISDNRANSGAGLYISNYNLTVNLSTFRNNTATAGEGGAAFLDCAASSMCDFEFANTTFERNFASEAGGAVSWKIVKPRLSDADFLNNFAPYGPDLASFPIKLNVSLPRRMDELTVIGVPPGQDSGIRVIASLIDHYGQVASNDNSSYAEMRSADLRVATVSGVSKVVASSGMFYFENFQVYSQPGKAVALVISSPAVASNTNTSDTDVHIQFDMRECQKGETKTDLSCLVCGQGTYNFNESQPCQNCPNNAECLGRAIVLPVPGFWKPENYSITVVECPRKASCLGGRNSSDINLYGFCAEGYKSNLCQSCAPDYFRAGRDLCQKCPDFTANIVQSAFIAIAALIAVVILVWSSMHSALKPKSVSSIYLKILLNYVQVLYLVSEIDLSWPDDSWSFLQFQRSMGGVAYYAFSPDCLLGGTQDTSNVFYRKMIFLAVLPIVVLIGSAAFWGTVALSTHKITYMKEQFLATLVIVFFFIHPTLVQAFFSMFSCKEILPGEYWLTLDMATRCWSIEHLKYLGFVGIPSVLVWIIGIPMLILAVLLRNRHHLDSLSLRKAFGFLITGYDPQHFYWEFVVLFRKIGIICISSFFADTAATQALGVLMILLLYTFWFFHVHPYTTGELNRLEVSAVAAADFTIYAGLFYLVGNLSEGGKWFFFLVIVIPNIVFYAIWISEMLKLTGIPFFTHSSQRTAKLLTDQYMTEFISTISPSLLARAVKFPFSDLSSIYHKLCQGPLPRSIPQQYGTVLNYRSRLLCSKSKYSQVAPLNNSEMDLYERNYRGQRVRFPSLE